MPPRSHLLKAGIKKRIKSATNPPRSHHQHSLRIFLFPKLANTFEAFIGALYLDQGYDAAQKFISDNLFPKIEKIVAERLWQDAKSTFQEKAQEEYSVTPSYELVSEVGPDHDKKFIVAAMIKDEAVAQGEGRSKQEAEQAAARKAIEVKGW